MLEPGQPIDDDAGTEHDPEWHVHDRAILRNWYPGGLRAFGAAVAVTDEAVTVELDGSGERVTLLRVDPLLTHHVVRL